MPLSWAMQGVRHKTGLKHAHRQSLLLKEAPVVRDGAPCRQVVGFVDAVQQALLAVCQALLARLHVPAMLTSSAQHATCNPYWRAQMGQSPSRQRTYTCF